MNSSLNHVYRIIWNAALGLWQVASEATRGRGKTGSSQQARKARRALAAATAMTLASPAAWAVLPTGGNVVAGSATISQAGSALNINQASDKAAIDWQSFSIGQGNSVNFVQPSATSVALNRVLGNDVSVIQGAINANGQVFLVNQNGVLFTPTAQVNVGGIVASTQNISTADFMAGKYEFSGNSTATVENQGSITAANGGVVALVAAKVINSGTITAPQGTVGLAAGNTVLLDLGGPVKIQVTEGALNAAIEQSGGIRADGGTIYLTAKAAGNLAASVINHSGVTRALTMASLTGEPQGQTGSIALSADQINHTGTLDVSGLLAGQHGGDILAQGKHYTDSGTTLADGAAQGGNIDVRATNITQTQGAKVSASSSDGQGGRIEMIGDLGNGRAEFAGQILATGRRRGGFIETSGATVKLNENTLRINAGSSEGKAGIWVIDPKDYTIAASGGDVTGAFLSQQLKNQSVQIYSTQGASEGNGDIHVNDTITATSGQSLGLYAERDININKSISINLLLLAAKGSVNVNDVVTVNEYLELNYGANSNFSANTSVRPSDTAALNMKMTRDGFVGKINLGVSANEVSINGNAQTILRNATDLAGVANGLSGQYVLASDISLAAVADWTSIGAGLGFKGALEGLGHLASGLSITSNRTQAGLFSSVAGGTLTNLGVGGSIAFANQSVGTRTAGGLAGSVSGASTLRNLYSTVAVDVSSGSNAILGGLLGSIAGTSTLTNAYATGSVKASGVSTSHNAGGLIGQIGSGTSQVSRVYAAGSVSASGSGVGNAGGLIGIVSSSFTLSQAYATGSVQANGSTSSNAGGLVSVLSSGTMVVSIDNVFATGAVSGSGSFQQFGGLLGNSGTVSGAGAKTLSNAYWNSATTGQALAVASNSAAQPTQINVVNAAIGTAGTAFPNLDPTVWNIVNGTPVLKVFQTIAAPAITPVTYTLQTLTGTYTYKAEQYNLADLWATSTIFTDCTVCTSWTAGTDYNFTYSGNVVTGFTNANTYSGIGINVLKPGFSLATTGNTTGSLTIDQAKISGVTGITAESKTYDGLRAATLNTSAAQFTGLLAADAGKVTVASAIGTFNTKDATQNKIVNISDITLGGVGAVNYRLDNASTTSFTLPGSSQPMIITLPNTANTATTTATITPKALNITDGSVVTRDYDGTRTATVNVGVLSGQVELGGQAETLGITTAAGTFDDADAGAHKDVAVKYTLTNGSGATGGLASNYTLADGSLKGTITPRALTVALQGTTANPLTKVYNGNANLALSSANFLLGNFVGEQGTGAALNGITSGIFNDANVLQANTVTANLTGSTLALAQGVKASNYSLSTEPVAAAGTITAKAVQVTGLMAQNKEYNGLLNATITGTATVASDAFIQNDDVSVSGNVTGGVFTSKDAGTDIAVSVTGLSLTGNKASNYQVTAPGLKANITPKEVIVDGIVASGKTYDGNDTAELTNQGAVATGIVGETLTVATTGSFNDKNAGARKVNTTTTIATNGTTLASNYTLSNASNSVDATIAQKAVMVSGIVASGKTYDGNATAELTNQGAVATGIVGETLTVATTGSFNDKNAGARKVNTTTTIATNGTTLASNYTLSNATNAVDATIAQKAVLVAGIVANGKTYDGNATAELTNQGTVATGIVGETLTVATSGSFNDKNAGDRQVNTLTTIANNGATLANNYSLSNSEGSVNATIAQRALTITGSTVTGRDYDGTKAATVVVGSLNNLVVGETLGTTTATGTFADKDAGSNKDVTVAYTLADGEGSFTTGAPIPGTGGTQSGPPVIVPGTLASNYTLANQTLKGSIAQKAVNVSGIVAKGKTYDGNATAELTNQGTVATGIVGETLTVATTGSFNDKNAGDRKVNTTTTIATNGTTLASNYSLSNATNAVDATIAQKAVTVAGIVAEGKTYDGNANAKLTNQGTVATGIVGETLTVATTGSFSNKNAGDRKVNTTTTIATNGTTLAGNYTLSNASNSVDATIAKKAVTVLGIVASGKTYDGNATAELTNQGTVATGVSGESLAVTTTGSFNNKNAGDRKVNTTTTIASTGDTLASNYTLSNATNAVDATIAQKAVTVSGIAAEGKTYDGNTTAKLTNQGTVATGISGETLTVATTGSFDKKNAGARKVNTLTTIANNDTTLASNYMLSNASNSVDATITQKALTIAATAMDKVYDGKSTATATLSTKDVLGKDEVTLNQTAANFINAKQENDKNVGQNKTVRVTGLSLTGADAANYLLTNGEESADTTANLTAKSLTIAATASDKVYNASTTADVTLSTKDMVTGDTLTLNKTAANFDTKDVGTGKTVTVEGLSLGGADAGNYIISSITNANGKATDTADISKAALSVSGITAENKTYDGTANATVSTAKAQLKGLFEGDKLSVSATGSFADKTAATGKTVTLSSSYSGADVDNYTITDQATTTADISKLGGVKVIADKQSKTVSAADPQLTFTVTGLLAGDKLDGSLARESGEAAGLYDITQGSLANENYLIDGFTPAQLTISQPIADVAIANAQTLEPKLDLQIEREALEERSGDIAPFIIAANQPRAQGQAQLIVVNGGIKLPSGQQEEN